MAVRSEQIADGTGTPKEARGDRPAVIFANAPGEP